MDRDKWYFTPDYMFVETVKYLIIHTRVCVSWTQTFLINEQERKKQSFNKSTIYTHMLYVSQVLLIYVEADSAELMDLCRGRQRVFFGYLNCVSCFSRWSQHRQVHINTNAIITYTLIWIGNDNNCIRHTQTVTADNKGNLTGSNNCCCLSTKVGVYHTDLRVGMSR